MYWSYAVWNTSFFTTPYGMGFDGFARRYAFCSASVKGVTFEVSAMIASQSASPRGTTNVIVLIALSGQQVPEGNSGTAPVNSTSSRGWYRNTFVALNVKPGAPPSTTRFRWLFAVVEEPANACE